MIFRRNVLVKAIKLEGRKTVTANWYKTNCLPEILKCKRLTLHHDNASSNSENITIEFLDYILDPILLTFLCLIFSSFFILEKNVGIICIRKKRIITQLLTPSIPRNGWNICLQKGIDLEGNYFEHF